MKPPLRFVGLMRKNLVNSVESPSRAGLRFEVSSFGPRLFYISRKSGGTVGAIAAHIADILGCGEPDLSLKARCVSEKRFGKLRPQGNRGHGNSPGEGFLCDVDPGGPYEELETHYHLPEAAGRPEGTPVVG